MLFSCGETHFAGVIFAYTSSLPYRNYGVAEPQLLSTKKPSCRRNSGVNALGDGSSQVAVGAKLLAKADEQKAADDRVDVLSHVALRGRKNPVDQFPVTFVGAYSPFR